MKLNTILLGDNITTLKTLPDNSVDCCVTSPPYFNLRDYGVDEQIGNEKTPERITRKYTTLKKWTAKYHLIEKNEDDIGCKYCKYFTRSANVCKLMLREIKEGTQVGQWHRCNRWEMADIKKVWIKECEFRKQMCAKAGTKIENETWLINGKQVDYEVLFRTGDVLKTTEGKAKVQAYDNLGKAKVQAYDNLWEMAGVEFYA